METDLTADSVQTSGFIPCPFSSPSERGDAVRVTQTEVNATHFEEKATILRSEESVAKATGLLGTTLRRASRNRVRACERACLCARTPHRAEAVAASTAAAAAAAAEAASSH